MASSEIRANVEQPRVCWLSSPEFAKLESSTTLQDQIRDIVEHLYICKNVDDCEYFIRGKHGHPQYEQIFLIATIDYLPLILKRDIHDVRVLETILILTENQCESSSMLKQYPKVRIERAPFLSFEICIDCRNIFQCKRSSESTFTKCR
jgi:hypothetical protein